MTPEEYQPLNRLYDDVAALCARYERRHGLAETYPADYTLNKTVFGSLQNIRDRLLTYVEASAPFFSEGKLCRDGQGVLDDSAERAEYVQQLVNDLRQLSDSTMNRVSTAPGSTARLSLMFAGTIRRERGDIQDLASRLSLLVQQEKATAQQRKPGASSVILVNFASKPGFPAFKGIQPA